MLILLDIPVLMISTIFRTPIEVLQHGQYSFESDIYRLGMTVYEFFTALDIYRSDPMADQLSCAPFAHIAHKDVSLL